MKDLSKFKTVQDALQQVIAESDVSNGTTGVTLLAHFWSQENMFDQDRQDIQTEIAKKLLSKSIEGIKELQKKLEGLPKPKIIMEFRLLQPIPRIQGTKTISDGDKLFKISMENVTSLLIPEDSVTLGLLEYEETEDVMKDSMGRDAQVIKLHIKKGLIDVAAPIVDKNNRVVRPKRAIVTAISYKAMQVAGELLSRERTKNKRRYGFDEQS